MKILSKNKLTQKIVIAIVIVLSFNFITPTYSQADFGGVLMGPIIDLIAGIGDSVMALLEVFMDGGDNELLKSDGFNVSASDFRGNAGTYGMDVGSLEGDAQTKSINADDLDQGWFGLGTYTIPIIKYSPEKIFTNEVPALDANFIAPKEYTGTQAEKSIAIQLRETISSWYNALRNLVIVGLLSVLLYVGIRIMITSTASDKAKYKKMLMDWLVALCLLFFLHYIMSFTMKMVEIVTEGISGATDVRVIINDPDGNIEFKTNLTGLCRMQVQYKDFGQRIVYLIFYIALVVYTFMFTWKYMKRAITLAFLTLMAPLVTLTYPIDKMGDGKAQAFNMWLKEYVFNALLQPFHLIIYTIFLGAGMDIVIKNPLYAILFLAFITPAEKILRKFFKFDQASTAGASFAGAFGGAAAFNMVKGFINKGAKGGQVGSGSGSSQKGIRQQRQITDPNAPDGSLTPFARNRGGSSTSPDARTVAASTSENTRRNQNPNEGAIGEDLGRAELYNNLREQGLTQEEALARVNEERPFERNQGAATSEDDQRGILQWGRDAAREKWDNSRLKQNMGEKKEQIKQGATKLKRNIKNLKPIRTMAAVGNAVKSKAEAGLNWTGEKYRSMPKPIRNSIERAGRTVKGAAGAVKKAAPRAIKGAIGVAKKAAPGAARLAGRTLAAGTMATVGIGMGIAGDEPENVLSLGLGGAALGWSTGPAIASNVAGGVASTGNAIREGYEEGVYGVEEARVRQQTRDYVSNEEDREFFEERIIERTGSKPSRTELNQVMRVAAEYNNAGVTGNKQINKAMLLEQELQQELRSTTTMTEKEARTAAREQAMTIALMAQGIDAKDLRGSRKQKEIQEDFKRELLSKDPSMGEDVAEAQASRILAMVKKQKNIY